MIVSRVPTSVAVAWERALEAALADPDEPRVVFQPLVDLQRGTVVGYEALARFGGPPEADPDRWFAAAEREGLASLLEARVLRRALAARALLPRNCFLSVNVSPNLVVTQPVRAVFADHPDLTRMVLELTEHVAVEDYDALTTVLAEVRLAGAMVAVDDAGTGYAGLRHILMVRPQFVKLDRFLVAGLDRDEAKVATVETLGELAGRIDAWLVAEGIERVEELDALVRLGVPLGQGYLLAQPGQDWAGVDDELTQRMSGAAVRRSEDTVAGLVEQAPVVARSGGWGAAARLFAADEGLDLVVALDARGRPVALWPKGAGEGGPPASTALTLVRATSDPATVARRAMTRDPAVRFAPLVCCDERGRYVGIVRIERLVERLAR